MICPISTCGHDMTLLHDGDGTEENPYICAACDCAFVVNDGHPERIVVDDD